MDRYALIGAGGYVAPRHMQAIRAVGGDLVVAYDPSDSVGVLDSHFPDAHFFVEFERFDRHVDKLRRRGEGVSRIAVCSPNHLHDAHVRFALRSGADAVCEKPLVLNPWNIDGLAEIAEATGRRVDTILQLRLHPAVRALRERVVASARRHALDLTYVTSRGRWYDVSWKGDEAKSGGIATNIGVHFFDMLHFVFGPAEESVLHLREPRRMAGFLRLRLADVRWFLSIDRADLPPGTPPGRATHRSVLLDGEEFEFSEGFGDLHAESYREIVAGRGFGLDDVRPSIEIVSALRRAPAEPLRGEVHPFARRLLP